jgi:fused signal recognition particle receptor
MGIFDVFKSGKQPEADKAREEEQHSDKLEEGLEKTKSSFFSKLGKALVGKSQVDEEVLDELEDVLVSADVGADTTVKIIERIEKRVAKDKYATIRELNLILREEIQNLMLEGQQQDFEDFTLPTNKRPYIIMVVGVNGVGKTTTIGKLAYQYQQQGYSVLLGASDTFRAAAVDQISVWADRVNAPLINRGMNSDPGAVAYDTVNSAIANNYDVVILDTAGRLHNKKQLMNELEKIKRVVQKLDPNGPDEVNMVLDASTGQNAVEQARQFLDTTAINTLTLTKLDGTAKGGVVIGIIDQFRIPIKYIGVGERSEDLRVFDRKHFVDSLFENADRFSSA